MSTFSQSSVSQTPFNKSSVSPLKRKAMSVTQTYYLAHTARGKLSHEAARSDHNLRLLVGHANLLDSLMLELAEAEQEQESWFNQSVRKASSSTTKSSHIQWADSIVEEPEQDWEAEDADSSDSDSEYDDEEDMEMDTIVVPERRVQQTTNITTMQELDEEEYEDDEEDLESLQLTHTVSHAAYPPELDHDSDSSEDESMPPSPPSDALPSFSEKQQIATTSYYAKSTPSIPESQQQAFFDEGFYLPQRAAPGLISAISVY